MIYRSKILLLYFFGYFLFTSCIENPELSSLDLISNTKSLEKASGVTLNFSDFGKSKLLLKAPQLIKFLSDNQQLIMECPSGLELIFYDSLNNVESTLIADYGKLYTEKEFLNVKNNVRFDNYNLDTLFAQELDIDFAKDSIYSEKMVIFSNKEGRISGTNLIANSNFTFFQLSDISEGYVNYELE